MMRGMAFRGMNRGGRGGRGGAPGGFRGRGRGGAPSTEP